MGVANSECCLKTYYSHCASFQTSAFLICRVGSVVGCYAVDCSVFDSFYEGVAVFTAADGRVHLEASFVLEVFVAEYEVVGPRLASDLDSAFLRLAYKLDALFRGDMAYVVAASGFFGELKVARYLSPFAFGADSLVAVCLAVFSVVDIPAFQEVVDFAVCGYDHVKSGGFLHGFAHHVVALHSASVVGESYRISLKGFHVYELPPFAVYGDRRIRIDVDGGVFLYYIEFLADMLYCIWGGVEVRHGAYCRVASHHRGCRSGVDCLLGFESRLAQMHVHVAEPVAYESAVHIQYTDVRIIGLDGASAFYPDYLVVDYFDGGIFRNSVFINPKASVEHIVRRHQLHRQIMICHGLIFI